MTFVLGYDFAMAVAQLCLSAPVEQASEAVNNLEFLIIYRQEYRKCKQRHELSNGKYASLFKSR